MAHSIDDLLVRQVSALVSETADAYASTWNKFLPWNCISMMFSRYIALESKGWPPLDLQASRPREFKRVWSTGRL